MQSLDLHSLREVREALSPQQSGSLEASESKRAIVTILAMGDPASDGASPTTKPGAIVAPAAAGAYSFDVEAQQTRCDRCCGAAAGEGKGCGSSPMILRQLSATTPKRTERTHGDHDDPMTFYPVPRFPPAHTSAAFEAMAVRKSLILTPPEIYAECAHHGEEKAKHGWLKMTALTVIAGCYVGLGFTLCLLVGGNIGMDIYKERPGLFSLVFGAVGFPTGFTFIVVCGGELFTSLCAYMAAAWWEGKVSAAACLRVWVVSWVGNFAGAAIFTGLMLAGRSFEHKEAFALMLAAKKTHHGFGSCFVLGIFCNWLVCIATWMSCAAQDMTGKVVAIWLPISAFVMCGYEHIIANQYLLPLAIALGAPINARDVIVGNLIPTTLGNWVGGAFFVGTIYAFAYGRPNAAISAWLERRRRTAIVR